MREIEFRVWRPDLSLMIPWEQIGGYDYSLDGYLNNEPWCYAMQYTGLKDKNGVKIFEGDVVLDVDGKNTHRNDYQVYPIGTEESACGRPCLLPCFPLQQRCVMYDMSDETNRLEVIGNIYQNPELLEDKGLKHITQAFNESKEIESP